MLGPRLMMRLVTLAHGNFAWCEK